MREAIPEASERRICEVLDVSRSTCQPGKKEECVWLRDFRSYEEARRKIGRRTHCYKEGRPHQSLGYLSPKQVRLKQAALVA